MTFALEVGPDNLCVSLRKNNQGHAEWIEACASMHDGEKFRVVGATLCLFSLRDLRAAGAVNAKELVKLHGFGQLSEDQYVNDRFERFEPLRVDRLLVLTRFHVGSSSPKKNLDLALLRRTVELTHADLLLVPWPPPGPSPERWAGYLSSTALTVRRDHPAWLYQRARERWPVELVQPEKLQALINEHPSLQRTGT